jgi:cation diffusion facilitator family transporter
VRRREKNSIEIRNWQHRHTFGTDEIRPGERRTRWVIVLTVVAMVVEIAAGLAFGSMALLADGLHMATHAVAFGITAFAYAFARWRANDERYSFGTGKVGALGGFASAILLAVVAVYVLAESAGRIASPIQIAFDEAIAVAVLGLVVNLVCAVLLHEPGHEGEGHQHHHHDHNLRGAYLHVLADAVTSVLAIIALVAGKFLGWSWADALTGILGSIFIGRWSVALLQETSAVLLDAEVPIARREEILAVLEEDGDARVADLHLWRVGPRHLAAIVSIVTSRPREPDHYKGRLRRFEDLAHVTVEVHPCAEPGEAESVRVP